MRFDAVVDVHGVSVCGAESHAAQPDRRDLKGIGSELALIHAVPSSPQSAASGWLSHAVWSPAARSQLSTSAPMLGNLLALHRQTFTDPPPWARGGIVTHGAAKATDRVRDERVDRLASEVVAVGEG